MKTHYKQTCTISIVFLSFLFTNSVTAQLLTKEWAINIGGSGYEAAVTYINDAAMDAKSVLAVDKDGNVIVAVGSSSNNGMIPNYRGGVDCFIVKFSSDGTEMWTKSFGGTGDDKPRDIVALSNGDFVVVGYTTSNDVDLTGHKGGNDGLSDGFIARFDGDGNVLWAKQYGGYFFVSGTGLDYLFTCIENKDGNIVAAGNTNSQNGDLAPDWNSSNPSFSVGWFLEVNSTNGAIIQSKRVRSSNHDQYNMNDIESIVEEKNGTGYYTLGFQGYGFNGTHWVNKVDSSGTLIWENEIGDIRGFFVYEASIVESYDNNLMVAITTGDSNTFGYSGGLMDAWVLKLSSGDGNVMGQQCFGGTSSDYPYKLLPDGTGKYYLAGCAGPTTGDDYVHGGSTSYDNYLIYMNEALDTLWTSRFGGTDDDRATDIGLDNSGNLFVTGLAESSDEFYTNNFGLRDAWVGKFSNALTGIKPNIGSVDFELYPNPASDILHVRWSKELMPYQVTYRILDLTGRVVENGRMNPQAGISTMNLQNGVYLLELQQDNRVQSSKFTVCKG